MPQLNTRRAQQLKTEKIAVLNEGGTVHQLREIFSHILDNDDMDDISGYNKFYFIDRVGEWNGHSVKLDDGYTAHPISWFFEADEDVKPTFEELKAMSLEDRIEALKKMGYVIGAEYRCAYDGFIEKIESYGMNAGFEFGSIDYDGDIEADRGYLYRNGKWAEIISKPDEAPQQEALPEYVKVVKCENPSRWYSGKIGEPFKVESQDCEAYTVTYNGASNFYIIYTSDCIPCDANGNPIGEQPEPEIIGWELMIDVPEWNLRAGKSIGKYIDTPFWIFSGELEYNESKLPESILRDMKSARPIYKRTTTDILNAVKQGTMSVDEAVKELGK